MSQPAGFLRCELHSDAAEFPLAGRSGVAAQRPGYGGIGDFEPAPDDRQRCEADVFTEPRGPGIQARPRSVQA